MASPIDMRLAEPAERAAVGGRIDPATALVWFVYGEVLDPYGDYDLREAEQQSGRLWFAADPEESVAIHLSDVPERVRNSLTGKRQAADRKEWQRVLRTGR